VKTKEGAVTIGASTNVTVKTSKAFYFDVNAAGIRLVGRGATGKAVTSLTHRDYITGAYLKGSQTVKATA
jgi:hypothetical protein